MNKFFVEKNNIEEKNGYITGEDVKHIYKVLRLKNDDEIYINAYSEMDEPCEYIAKITDINKEKVTFEIIGDLNKSNEPYTKITLFQGIPKSTKFDYIVQKGTEIGIRNFVPVQTDRVIKSNDSEFKRLDRLKKIALEAAKQSKRSIIPKLLNETSFESVIKEIKNFSLFIVPYENEENYSLKDVFSEGNKYENVGILIGPEGGFTENEIKTLKESGAKIVTLGNRILRTETAGIVTSSIILYEQDDMR